MKNKKSQLQTMKKVLTYIRSYRIFLVLSLIFAIVAVASTLYFPVLTGQVIDHILAPGQVDFAIIMDLLWKMGLLILEVGRAHV